LAIPGHGGSEFDVFRSTSPKSVAAKNIFLGNAKSSPNFASILVFEGYKKQLSK
jgi:hypothetical protein